ncbi:uncharacterized protein LOC134832726 [Culicoides brevitarsis]|uniref:uncharacterized protein LOC134832726 n=1 Tax=Culicoides brevitarsis TaxID=469753 RepID=UPI00307B44AA
MSTDNRLLLIILLFITLLSGQQTQHLTTAQVQASNKSATPIETGSRYEGGRAIYSPQLEYTEWVPLGRGDPLKNDPTYDYSPPKVDFVKYWADGTGHKEKGKTELLLLGVPQQRHKEPANKHQATRRNFAFNDLPTMLMPPPPASKQFNDHINPHVPIESYKMPVQPLNWNNNRKSVIDTYVEPGPAKTYTTIFRPILSSTIYQYHHTYKAPPVEGPNFIDTFHKPHVIHESYKIPLDNTELFLPTKPPSSSNNDLFFASSESRKPALIKTLEGSPFAKPSQDKHFTVSDSVDAQSINYAFTYQTTSTTTSTEKPTTPYVPLPPPPPETTTTQAPETTTSMYARFEPKTKPPRGPMSLVIEGHSKVKTYKPGQFDPKEKHRPVLVPIQSADPIQRRVINTEENGVALEVKHLHSSEEKKSETKKIELTTPKSPEKKLEKEGKEEKSAFSSLLSFLDTSFGDLVVQEESSEEQLDEENKIGAKNLEQNGGSDNNIRRSARNISPNEPHFVLKKLKP